MPVIPNTFKKEGRFETNPYDFYATPIELCRATLQLSLFDHIQPKKVLDPGCGTGNWGKAIKEKWPKCYLTGLDIDLTPSIIDKDYDQLIRDDYIFWASTATNYPSSFDLIVGNPPFTAKGNKRLAEQFIRKSMELLAPGGGLVFLLPNQFTASKIRYKLFEEYRPRSIIQLAERPSFYGNGKTNTHEYSLLYWSTSVNYLTSFYWLKWKNGVELL